MTTTASSKSYEIRKKLNHPIIDADGHMRELSPIFLDYLRQVGGSQVLERYNRASDRYTTTGAPDSWYKMSWEERRDSWTVRPAWWGGQTKNALDRATSMSPKLLHERMDEMGIDFAVLYPTQGLELPAIWDDELRQVACRAFNTYIAETYREYADRMTPVAVVPVHTPQEGIREMEHVVKELRLKVAMVGAPVLRPVAKVAREHPDLAGIATRLDLLGLDADHDYDPFWAKCVELGVAPTFHSSSMGWGSHRSISNYMYNHLGHFADSGVAMCKALFMGGVTRRFPTLRFAFLEGGVGWACSLYNDMIGHWEKRNGKAIQNIDPANLDRGRLLELLARYGDHQVTSRLAELRAFVEREQQRQPRQPEIDEWAACRIERVEEIKDLFEPHFYFGCEADDPVNAWAFNGKLNRFGARLRAMLGSDIGHWDVTDMTLVLAEAYEMVEHGVMTKQDFRDFTFTNAVRLHAGMAPDFFKGTAIEGEANKLIASDARRP